MTAGKPVGIVVHPETLVGRCAVRAARARGYRPLLVDGRSIDTCNPAKVEAFARGVDKTTGSVELLVICPAVSAARDKSGSLMEGDPARWQALIQRIVLPPLCFARSFGRRMRVAGQGRIVQLVSNAAFEPRRGPDGSWVGSPALAAAMAAVAAMSRQLAAEFGDSGVLVNSLLYGALEGDEPRLALAGYAARSPLGRPLARAELERSLDLFLDPDCRYVTGHNLVVDGGAAIW